MCCPEGFSNTVHAVYVVTDTPSRTADAAMSTGALHGRHE